MAKNDKREFTLTDATYESEVRGGKLIAECRDQEWFWRVHKANRHPSHDPQGEAPSVGAAMALAINHWREHRLKPAEKPSITGVVR